MRSGTDLCFVRIDNIFCKRPVYSDTYLPTFNRPNVHLVDTSGTHGVQRITEKGVVVGDKEFGELVL